MAKRGNRIPGAGTDGRRGEIIFQMMLSQVKKRKTVAVSNIDTLSPADRAAHEGFHAPGVQSFLFTPLFYGRRICWGSSAVMPSSSRWYGRRETQSLVKCVGSTIVNALLRQQAEKAPAEVRETILRFVKPTPPANGDNIFEYEGPIEVVEEELQPPDSRTGTSRRVNRRTRAC
jgi:hypothetical protein